MTTDYEGTDFYCDVALKNREALEIVYEDEYVLAFNHTKPHWRPIHIVVIPKKHIPSFTNYLAEHTEDVSRLISAARTVAKDIEERYGAARVLTNLGNYQDSKHFHIHVAFGDIVKKI